MAKKSRIETNEKRKRIVKKYAKRRAGLIAITKDKNASFEDRLKAQILLSEMPRNSAKVRVRNRCALTGRPRGYLREFNLSRVTFREYAAWGLLPGIIKSSW
ncbi:30S ribosomal protein S14 [Pseudomonadota bacterium]